MTSSSTLDRRGFLRGAAATAGAATAMTAAGSRVAFADPADAARGDVLVYVFLRGGADCLSILPPVAYPSYYDHRGNIAVTQSEAISIGHPVFGLHPEMAPLTTAWNNGHLAFIPASGVASSLSTNRSHFEMQEIHDRAQQFGSSGWVARHVATSADTAAGGITAVSIDRYQHVSLSGTVAGVVSFAQIAEFDMFGYHDRAKAAATFSAMYPSSSDPLLDDGQTALRSVSRVRNANPLGITPQTTYGGSSFDRQLREAAQLIRADLGVRAITIDNGGWDVHNNQGNASSGIQRDLIVQLARGLGSFYDDMGAQMNEVTVVVVSEFGRTNARNGSGGTDHGRGGIMMALGRRVNGGVHGDFPSRIEEGPEGDLAVVTDYRRVLSELVAKRLDNGANLGTLFPAYDHPGHLGVFAN